MSYFYGFASNLKRNRQVDGGHQALLSSARRDRLSPVCAE
jgi:hypothetical protein